MKTAIELRQERARIWEQAKALHTQAETEKRALTPEEQASWDKMMADIDDLKTRIDALEAASAPAEPAAASQNQASRMAVMARMNAEMAGYQSRTGGDQDHGGQREQEQREHQYREAFGLYLRYGREALAPEQRTLMQKGYKDLKGEMRALTTLTGASGGYAIPEGAMQPLTKAMLDWGGIRRARTTKLVTSDGREIPWPTANDTSNIGRRITENQPVSTQDPSFGAKVLRAYIYTSDAVLIPFALTEDVEFDLEGFLLESFGTRIGRIENSEDTTGTGDSMPEGLVTAATLGKTAAAAGDIEFDELIDLELSVYAVYRQNAEWMLNSNTLGVLRKKVDDMSRPLWSPGVAGGTPDRIWNYPYVINEDMPDIAASAKVMLFGDMSAFKIRDVRGVQILRLVERYADYGQVGYLAFHRHDAKLIDAGTHPIKVLQMHS